MKLLATALLLCAACAPPAASASAPSRAVPAKDRTPAATSEAAGAAEPADESTTDEGRGDQSAPPVDEPVAAADEQTDVAEPDIPLEWPEQRPAWPGAKAMLCGLRLDAHRIAEELFASMRTHSGARTIQCGDIRGTVFDRGAVVERKVPGGPWQLIGGNGVPMPMSFEGLECMGFRREQTCGRRARYRRTQGNECRAAIDVERSGPTTVSTLRFHVERYPPPLACEP